MSAADTRIFNPAPLDYTTPDFPGLYWPYRARPGTANYLYYTEDTWRFTLLWTLIIYAGFHLAAAALAVAVQFYTRGRKAWRIVWIIPLVYAGIAGIEALVAGSVVGLILGVVYNAGALRMSTWIPFVWALINMVVLLLSSFAIQAGL